MNKIILYAAKAIGLLLATVAVYLLFVFALPYIRVNKKPVSEPENITIYILTNGVHTDFVLPIKSGEIDWSTEILFENTRSKKTAYRYLAIGWGDKGFYLDTPTWADLKFSTAFKAAFWLSESAMHCTFYENVTEGKDCKKLTLTKKQYLELIKFIRSKFDRDSKGNPILIETNAVYGDNDAFYDAKGRYNFLDTCNTWTNEGLKVAGQKAAWWTATDIGIFQHYQ